MQLKTVLAAAIIVGGSWVPAYAQGKVEVSAIVGSTFADGVSGDPGIIAGDGIFYDRIDPKDSVNWGLSLGFATQENYEVGFKFGQQMSTLEISGPTITRDIGDITVSTYHGYFGYNGFAADAKVRPYALFGLGATNYGGVSFTRINGDAAETSGNTQFSTTFGAGVKVYAGNVGARFGIGWTPTYIKSDSEGYWCDPYWGCYVVGSAQYSSQWDFSGGIILRF